MRSFSNTGDFYNNNKRQRVRFESPNYKKFNGGGGGGGGPRFRIKGRWKNNEDDYREERQWIPEEEEFPLDDNPLRLIDKTFTFQSDCCIPDSIACNECKARKKTRCHCSSVATMGCTDAENLQDLENVKTALNQVRSDLDHLDISEWKKHTSRTIQTSNVVRTIRSIAFRLDDVGPPEMVTNAWCKMYEMLRACQLINITAAQKRDPPEFRSVHLCECPGAFICAVNHYLQTSPDLNTNDDMKNENYTVVGNCHKESLNSCHADNTRNVRRPVLNWKAVSLNPYFEGNDLNAMIDDDAFYRYTHSRWLRGENDSGNIKLIGNIESFAAAVQKPPLPSYGPIPMEIKEKSRLASPTSLFLADLVTADGSVDSQFNANEQESITAGLHFAEFVCGTRCLGMGGHMVIKMFTLFEHHSLSILALMSTCFKKLIVVKPMMSRDGSGEIYVVGKNFKGITTALVRRLQELIRLDICDLKKNKEIFPRQWIPSAFYEEFVNCARLFAGHQEIAIKGNLASYRRSLEPGGLGDDFDRNIREKRREKTKKFLQKFAIRPIQPCLRLCTETLLEGGKNNSTRPHRRTRVQGLQSDRLEFKIDFDAFQATRSQCWSSQKPELSVLVASANTDEQIIPHERTADNQDKPSSSTKESIGMLLMKKMGHKQGEGLGVLGQGIIEPLSVKMTLEKRGLRSSADFHGRTGAFSIDSISTMSYLLHMRDLLIKMNSYFDNWNRYDKYYAYKLKQQEVSKEIEEMLKTRTNYAKRLLNGYDHKDWLTFGTIMLPYELKLSRFVEETLLTKLIRIRLEECREQQDILPLTVGDCWLLEGGQSRLSKHEGNLFFPQADAVHLVLLLRECMKPPSGEVALNLKEQENPEHYLAWVFKNKLKSFMEITGNGNFPLASILSPLGIETRILFSHQQLVHEFLKERGQPDNATLKISDIATNIIQPLLPEKTRLTFCSPFRKDYLTSVYSASSLIDLTLRDFQTKNCGPSDLVLIDPERCDPKHQLLTSVREPAFFELNSSMLLLAMTVVGLRVLNKDGDLILKIHSIYTRFTATLVIILSFHFDRVFAYRPRSVPSWTSVRYLYFQGSKYSGNEQLSPFSTYLSWCLSRGMALPPGNRLMQLLPPRCYTDAAFIHWITEWNSLQDEEELEERVMRSKEQFRSQPFLTSEERQLLCEKFLDEYRLRGFFWPSELTSEEATLLSTHNGGISNDDLTFDQTDSSLAKDESYSPKIDYQDRPLEQRLSKTQKHTEMSKPGFITGLLSNIINDDYQQTTKDKLKQTDKPTTHHHHSQAFGTDELITTRSGNVTIAEVLKLTRNYDPDLDEMFNAQIYDNGLIQSESPLSLIQHEVFDMVCPLDKDEENDILMAFVG